MLWIRAFDVEAKKILYSLIYLKFNLNLKIMHINKFLSATVAMLSIAATDTVCAANIKNQSITIKSIKQKDSANNASITVNNGNVWVFNGEGTQGLTVNGAAAKPTMLVVGQNCILNGVRSDTGGANTITTLACN